MSDVPPRRRLGQTLALVLVCVVATGIGFGSYRIWQQRAAVEAAAVRPDLEFRDLDGKPHRLSEWDGKLLLLNFWATWCPPCVTEMPMLDAFQRAQRERGWRVVGLAVDGPTPVREFLQRRPMGFAIGLAGLTGVELSRQLGNGTGGLPFTIVVGRSGQVIARKLGALAEADLARWAAAPS